MQDAERLGVAAPPPPARRPRTGAEGQRTRPHAQVPVCCEGGAELFCGCGLKVAAQYGSDAGENRSNYRCRSTRSVSASVRKATEAKLAAGPLDARGEMPASDGLGLGWNGPIRRGDNDGRGSAAVRVCSILKAVKSFESKSMLVRLSDLRPAVPWS